MFRIALTAAALATAAAPAFAGDLTRTTDGVTYFNKAGADLAAHDADLRECRLIAEQLHQPTSMAPTSVFVPAGGSVLAAGIGGAIGVAIAQAIQQKVADSKGHPVNIENCMVVKGWKVVAVEDAEAKADAALDVKAKQAKLAEWVGAETPRGQVLRAFANDAVGAEQSHVFALATKQGSSLSMDVVPDSKAPKGAAQAPPAAFAPQPAAANAPRMKRSANPPKPLTDAELGGVPAGSGLIAVNIKGDAEVMVSLERIGPNATTPAWVDGKPAQIFATRPAKAYAKAGAAAGATYVYAVPPGRWRVASVTVNNVVLNLCMGSPAFDLAAGEAVYAGSFDPTHLAPEMDLGPAKAAFPGVSPVAATIKAAEWTNGLQAQCRGGAYAYALEIPGRPFVEGYAVGSHALAKTATASAGAAKATD